MKKFFILCIFFSISVRGFCVEDYHKLPMFGGLTNLQNWVGTNTTAIAVNVFQRIIDKDPIGYMGGALIPPYKSYEEIIDKVRKLIAYYANAWISSGYYLKGEPLFTYVEIYHAEDLPDENWFFSSAHMSTKNKGYELKVKEGVIDFNSLESISLFPEKEIGFRLKSHATSVLIKLSGKVVLEGARVGTGEDKGAIFIKSNILLNTDAEIELSIGFGDGTILIYNSLGDLQGDYTPRLVTRLLDDGSMIIEVVGLFPDQTVSLESSNDLKEWIPYPGLIRATKPSQENPKRFYRIK